MAPSFPMASFFWMSLFSVAAMAGGCSQYPQTSTTKGIESIRSLDSQAAPDRDLIQVTSLSVAPPWFNEDSKVNAADRSRLARELLQAFRDELSLKISEPPAGKDAQGAADRSLRAATLGAARTANVDAVLFTAVDRYSSSEGTGVGSTAPAEIAFRMNIVRAADGKELWRANYAFHDQAVTDNLFALRKRGEGGAGPGWKNTAVLTQEAFYAAARKLQEARESGFSRRQ